MINNTSVPTHAGIYWAKARAYQWWNLIVFIEGEAPFLQLGNVIDLSLGKHISMGDIDEWGPEIIRPDWKEQ